MVESNSSDWGLCDHFLLALDHDDDVEEDYGDEWDESEEDDEWPLAPTAWLVLLTGTQLVRIVRPGSVLRT
jgi:hypothetical protein